MYSVGHNALDDTMRPLLLPLNTIILCVILNFPPLNCYTYCVCFFFFVFRFFCLFISNMNPKMWTAQWHAKRNATKKIKKIIVIEWACVCAVCMCPVWIRSMLIERKNTPNTITAPLLVFYFKKFFKLNLYNICYSYMLLEEIRDKWLWMYMRILYRVSL